MKYLTILTILFLFIGFNSKASAQNNNYEGNIGVGKFILGGEIYYYTQDTEGENQWDDEIKEISFSPFLGYFFKENLAVVGKLNYIDYERNNNDSDSMGLGAGLRYFLPLGSFYLYFGGMLELLNEDYEVGDYNVFMYGLSFQAGLIYMITKNFGISAGVEAAYLAGEREWQDWDEDIDRTYFKLGYLGVQGFF